MIKTLLLLLAMASTALAIPPAEVEQAFNKVKEQVGFTAVNVILTQEESPIGPHTKLPPADTAEEAEHPHAVIDMPASFTQLLTTDQVMFIIGHEFGHTQYNIRLEGHGKSQEIASDIFGMMILAEMGFSKQRLIDTAAILFATGEGGRVHPSGRERYIQVRRAIELYFAGE